MMKSNSCLLPSCVARSFTIGMLSVLGLVSGLPGLSGQLSLKPNLAAYAQSGEPEFTRYVRAAVEIEKLRQSLMTQAKRITGGNIPRDVCSPGGISQVQAAVRGNVQDICNTFQTQASAILRNKYDLSDERFNYYQQQADKPEMQQRITQELKRLRIQ